MKIYFNQIVVIFVLLLILPTLFAYSENDEVNRIADQLRCPTCQGLSVKESNSGLSVNMKNKIADLLNQGKTEKEVLTFFEERYGEWILRSPKKEGFNLLLWSFPFLFFIISVPILSIYIIKSKKQKIDSSENTAKDISEANTEFEKKKKAYLKQK